MHATIRNSATAQKTQSTPLIKFFAGKAIALFQIVNIFSKIDHEKQRIPNNPKTKLDYHGNPNYTWSTASKASVTVINSYNNEPKAEKIKLYRVG